MIRSFVLPAALSKQLEQEAQADYPRECCGLIEGVLRVPLSAEAKLPLRAGRSKGEATALHPVTNLAGEPDRFELDPATHIALLHGLRGTGREIIGCYHSHPNGRPQPSSRDVEGAGEAGFLWLIAALEGAAMRPDIACFVWTGSDFAPVHLVRPRGTGAWGHGRSP